MCAFVAGHLFESHSSIKDPRFFKSDFICSSFIKVTSSQVTHLPTNMTEQSSATAVIKLQDFLAIQPGRPSSPAS